MRAPYRVAPPARTQPMGVMGRCSLTSDACQVLRLGRSWPAAVPRSEGWTALVGRPVGRSSSFGAAGGTQPPGYAGTRRYEVQSAPGGAHQTSLILPQRVGGDQRCSGTPPNGSYKHNKNVEFITDVSATSRYFEHWWSSRARSRTCHFPRSRPFPLRLALTSLGAASATHPCVAASAVPAGGATWAPP